MLAPEPRVSSDGLGPRRKNPEMTLLAADIQEEILFLEVKGGVERISQRMLREVVCVADWREQRRRRTALRLRGRGTWARLKVTMRCAKSGVRGRPSARHFLHGASPG